MVGLSLLSEENKYLETTSVHQETQLFELHYFNWLMFNLYNVKILLVLYQITNTCMMFTRFFHICKFIFLLATSFLFYR